MSSFQDNSETERIGLLKKRDSESFRALVEENKGRVLNICFRFFLNREDAEDTAQDVFVEVYRSLPKFRGDSSLSTWIHQIAVAKSLDGLRKRKKRHGRMAEHSVAKAFMDDLPASESSSSPEYGLEMRERLGIIREAISGLAKNRGSPSRLIK